MDTAKGIASLRQRMAWEQDRGSLLTSSPALPPMPRERRHLGPEVWLCAGQLSQLPEPGSDVPPDLPGAPVFVARGRDGRVLDDFREHPDDQAADPAWRFEPESMSR